MSLISKRDANHLERVYFVRRKEKKVGKSWKSLVCIWDIYVNSINIFSSLNPTQYNHVLSENKKNYK